MNVCHTEKGKKSKLVKPAHRSTTDRSKAKSLCRRCILVEYSPHNYCRVIQLGIVPLLISTTRMIMMAIMVMMKPLLLIVTIKRLNEEESQLEPVECDHGLVLSDMSS